MQPFEGFFRETKSLLLYDSYELLNKKNEQKTIYFSIPACL